MYQVNDRISISGHMGSVRYSGYLHVWPDTLAYGIEWDDSSRGKNDGTLEGIRYFECIGNAGSFVKASNSKIDPRKLFTEAIEDRYGRTTNDEALQHSIMFSTKTVETVGFEKLNSKLDDYKNLSTLMLDRQCVLGAGKEAKLPNLEYLDLSYNLISLWHEIEEILNRTPNLKGLNLNGNRLGGGLLAQFPETLTDLSLCDCNLDSEILSQLHNSSINKLELAGNNLTDAMLESWYPPLTLKVLDLSYNNLSRIPPQLSAFNINEIFLHHNLVKDFEEKHCFQHISSLDVRYNQFLTFSLIDPIPLVFPSLKLLRLSHCPAFSMLLIERMTVFLIGRLQCMTTKDGSGIVKLNGSGLLCSEVLEAELFFASQLRNGLVAAINNPSRMRYYQEKYNVNLQKQNQSVQSDRIIELYVYNVKDSSLILKRKFLQNNTVLRLKGCIARQTRLSVPHFTVSFHMYNDENSSPRVLDDDIALLLSLSFVPSQKLYVSLKENCHLH
ncbi:hypothetical protein PUMCH_003472 [Australozyma saopauloensis]|uniref:CAP-Gly domain-containing protein n=1 Tax=Australozyma saopauloensis TaxID=291208 RepID=A0AAX4HE16_9ASCO|nr:hypothetical protein PUMCH_003472 [[Candida] saopauloensis]